MSTIIGRRQELEELERLYRNDRPEFVAVNGRRFVGKTFLIKQALKDRIVFQHTGVSPVDQEGAKNCISKGFWLMQITTDEVSLRNIQHFSSFVK